MDTLDVLVAARAEVEKGWSHYGWQSRDGVCAVHAAQIAAPDDALWAKACEALERALPDHNPERDAGIYVGAFNDAPTTTKAGVLALFDRAIAAEGRQDLERPEPRLHARVGPTERQR